MVGSSEAGIVRRRPFGRPISIVLSSSHRGGETTSQDAAGGEIESDTKPVEAEPLRRPLRIPNANGSTMIATIHIAAPSPTLAEDLAGSP